MDEKYGKNGKIWMKYGNMDKKRKIWKNMENMDKKVQAFMLKLKTKLKMRFSCFLGLPDAWEKIWISI
jgi:hypothetical protein